MTRPWRLLLGLHLAFAASAGLAYLLEPPARGQALVLVAAVVVAARRARTTRERLLAAPAVALRCTGALLVSLLLLDRGRLVLTG